MASSDLKLFYAAAAWILSILLGYGYLLHYHQVPSASRHEVREWPRETEISISSDKLTLVLAVHPQCPCTVATCRELSRLLVRAGRPVQIYALVYCPGEHADCQHWMKSFTMDELALLPRVKVVRDIDGVEAKHFHFLTSGDMRLFTPEKRLLFTGGITASRAHEGESIATDKLFALIRGESDEYFEYPVYGCRILEDNL